MSTWSPFLAKAKEFSAANQPVIAYFCKLYAASLGMAQRIPSADAQLVQLFDELEQDKQTLLSNEAIQKPSVGASQLRTLAFRLFLSAERDEQQGATHRRALDRYAAAVRLLQVYRGLFLEGNGIYAGEIEGSVEEDLQQVDEKSRYAKWRITELKKLIESAGSVSSLESLPTVSQDVNGKSTGSNSNVNINSNATYGNANTAVIHTPPTAVIHTPPTAVIHTHTTATPPTHTSNTHTTNTQSPPAYNLPLQQPIHSPVTPSLTSPTLVFDPKIITEAEKQARFAISAMHFDDLPTAIQNLQRAIALLQPLCDNKN